MQSLLDGIPIKQDYLSLIKSDEFNKMKAFSVQFLLSNEGNLGRYAKQWVKDPFSQWSRQWEYPFVFSRIKSLCLKNKTARILDAGSGVTFFPYYIKSCFPSTAINCADNDRNLEKVYRKINNQSIQKVEFRRTDLKKLPYKDDWFDVVYCVSVLEHTKDYGVIIEEFHRILKPGGSLFVTFDLSLDGSRDVTIKMGTALLELLTQKFATAENTKHDLNYQVDKPDIFTTLSANEINTSLLPWKLPSFLYQIKSLILGRGFIHWPPLLTIYCASFAKHLKLK